MRPHAARRGTHRRPWARRPHRRPAQVQFFATGHRRQDIFWKARRQLASVLL